MRWYFIDRILALDPGKSIVGIKSFTRSELFFMDHFHGYPVVPGVLQIEMIATTGGKAIKVTDPTLLPMLVKVENAKFHRPVRPGDQCRIEVELTKIRQSYASATGKITVDGIKVCEADVMYTIQPASIADTSWKDPVIAEWEQEQSRKAIAHADVAGTKT
jgi:3-hydroxyacyl-[acyl-carrier-protein] dehydratase